MAGLARFITLFILCAIISLSVCAWSPRGYGVIWPKSKLVTTTTTTTEAPG